MAELTALSADAAWYIYYDVSRPSFRLISVMICLGYHHYQPKDVKQMF